MHKPDFADCRGLTLQIHQLVEPLAKRQPILLVSNPGCGATMIARRIPGVLPPGPGESEAWFRAPHHSCSGRALRGEARLAMDSVLFLDELPEFTPTALRALAAELRDLGDRAPQLVASAHPCPCGQRGRDEFACACAPAAVLAHVGRLRRALETVAGSAAAWQAIGIGARPRPPAWQGRAPEAEGPRSEEIRELVADAFYEAGPCLECAGYGWVHMADSCGRGPGIERCDYCKLFLDDEAAAFQHRKVCACGLEVAA